MKELIVRCKDETLVSIADGRRWIVDKSTVVEGSYVVGLVFPPANLDQQNAVAIVLATSESESECRAILESLAVRLGAVRWNPDKRTFVPVKSEDSND